MCKIINLEAARAALDRAAWTRGKSPAYCQEAVTDLLADIRHLCVAAGHNFDRCDRVASMYFQDQTGGAP